MQLPVLIRKNCPGFRGITRSHPLVVIFHFISLPERVAVFIALATIAEKYWNVRVLWHFAKCVLGHRVKIDFPQWNIINFRKDASTFSDGNNVSDDVWRSLLRYIIDILHQSDWINFKKIVGKNVIRVIQNIYIFLLSITFEYSSAVFTPWIINKNLTQRYHSFSQSHLNNNLPQILNMNDWLKWHQ